MPRWLLIALACGLGLFMLYTHASVNNEIKIMSRELEQKRVQIIQAGKMIEDLDVQIAMAADETRIRSVAVNRLGMQYPQENQIYWLRPMGLQQPEQTPLVADVPPQEELGFFRLLLSTLGF